jgi:hypothetical protein
MIMANNKNHLEIMPGGLLIVKMPTCMDIPLVERSVIEVLPISFPTFSGSLRTKQAMP